MPTLEVTREQLALLQEALDSHLYWQLSEEHERSSGFVYYPEPGSEEYEAGDPEDRIRWTAMTEAEGLIERLARL